MNDTTWGSVAKTHDKVEPKAQAVFIDPNMYMASVENRIYFYMDINQATVLKLNHRVRELSNNLIANAIIQEREPAKLFLHINSFGGSVFAGLSSHDEIKNCKVPVVTIIDGSCASAATFLSIAGSHRIIRPNAFMLIHQLSATTWGKYRELKDEHINHTKLMGVIKQMYARYTKIPTKKVDEILDHDLWFDAKTCLRYGLVDEIQ